MIPSLTLVVVLRAQIRDGDCHHARNDDGNSTQSWVTLLSSFFTADQALYFLKQKFSLSKIDLLSDSSLQWGDSFAALTESIDDQDSHRFFASKDVLQDLFNFTIDTLPLLLLLINLLLLRTILFGMKL